MIGNHCWLLAGLLSLLSTGSSVSGAESDVKKYLLRYQFRPGQTLRWAVEHRMEVDTTVSGISQTDETLSKSVKIWRVRDVKPGGVATFEHLVEDVDMRHNLTGRPEVRYNSKTDKQPPIGFQNLAKSVGVPLSVVTMDAKGAIRNRSEKKVPAAARSHGQMTVPFPNEPVPEGHTWSFPHDIQVTLPSGAVKKVKARQTFTLKSVKTGVATIEVATQILSPIDDPAVESQLIQRESTGTVRFDVDAGRILGQRMEVDKQVVGFRGPASSIHYRTRFTEKLLPEETETASRSAAARR